MVDKMFMADYNGLLIGRLFVKSTIMVQADELKENTTSKTQSARIKQE